MIGPEEVEAVRQVLESGMLAQGPKVAELEESFATFCGTKYAVALNSGTAALHCALKGVGIGTGDEVITTPFSFIATINPILMQGAKPCLVDIRYDDFNLDPELVTSAINGNTKAILGVDLYGQPYDYDGLNEIAKRHNLKLIEDACQSAGAGFGDKKAGSLGDAACFSLYATKNITSAEGGILTTDDPKVAESSRRFRQHGMKGPYDYGELGYNYRMTDILAAIGLEQLKKADGFNQVRMRNAELLNEGLRRIDWIETPQLSRGRTHVYHQYTIRVKPGFKYGRDELAEKLKERGVGSGVYYPKPLHFYPHIAALGYKKGDFPVAEKAADEVLSLPVHPKVTEGNIRTIVKVFEELSA